MVHAEVGDHVRGLAMSAASPHRVQDPPQWLTGYHRADHPHAPGTMLIALTPGSPPLPAADGYDDEHQAWVGHTYFYPVPRPGASPATGSATAETAPTV